jgi:hypothetical protein
MSPNLSILWLLILMVGACGPCKAQNSGGRIQLHRAVVSGPEKHELRTGIWGGEHIAMTVNASGADFEFDCAIGHINGGVETDSQGRFKASGTFTPDAGGPARKGQKIDARQAVYEGTVSGQKMNLVITLSDGHEPIGTFGLNYGHKPNLFKCK